MPHCGSRIVPDPRPDSGRSGERNGVGGQAQASRDASADPGSPGDSYAKAHRYSNPSLAADPSAYPKSGNLFVHCQADPTFRYARLLLPAIADVSTSRTSRAGTQFFFPSQLPTRGF